MLRQVLYNLSRIYTVDGGIKIGDALGTYTIINNGYIILEGETIVGVGEGMPDLDHQNYEYEPIDMQGLMATPGLIDAHTHLVFGGNRVAEYSLKLAGAGYMDILAAGGGILSTLNQTRLASKEQLYDQAFDVLNEMLACGVTTVEAKSGYGLDLDHELKQLLVAQLLDQSHPIDVVSTFMGAHAIPPEFVGRGKEYLSYLIDEVLPVVKQRGLAEFVDIFCEQGIFELEETRRYLEAAKQMGFGLKLHGDEMVALGGARLAGELDCLSAEHLMKSSDEDLLVMKEHGVVAVLLPVTSFHLQHPFARGQAMKAMNLILALATDYNPGSSPCKDMIWAMRIGSRGYQLTPLEVLAMATINAAHAIRRDHLIGSIEVGKQADVAFFEGRDWDEVVVVMGKNPLKQVMKKGAFVYP